VVSAAFSYALLYELVENNPAKASQPPKVAKREKMALSPSQAQLLIDAATIPWMPAFLALDNATGCRRGELLALDWTDLEGNVVTISKSLLQTKAGLKLKTTKTDDPRTIEIDDDSLKALQAHKEAQQANRDYFRGDYRGNLIFANPDGSYLMPNSVSSAVSALFRRLKIPKPKGAALHLLRHSHGSQLLASGVPVTEVSRRLGHKSAHTTMGVYAHALPNRDKEAAKQWAEFQRANLAKEKLQ
jgi:integrase